MDVCVVR